MSFQKTEEVIEPQEEAPLTVGAQLREAREARGLSLHQVADILRLRASQVHALEEGNFNSLPGQTFVTGFLRSYANLLDLDAVAIVELYKHEEGDGLRVPSLAFPEPSTGGRMPGAGILLGTLVFALILLAGWFFYQESESLDFERVAELPEHLASKIRDLDVIGTDASAPTDTASIADEPPKNMAEILQTSPTTETPEITQENTTAQTGNSDLATENPVDAMPQSEMSSEANSEPESNTAETINPPQDTADTDVATADTTADAATSDTVSENTAEAVEPVPAAENVESETETAAVSTEAATAEASDPNEATEAQTTSPQQTEVTAAYPQDTLQAVTSGEPATATEGTPESPMPRTFGVENTDARVVLRATEESWVEVKSKDNSPVLSQVLNPGDTYMAPNTHDLKLTTGNAGGLEIRVDGREIRSLGGTGTILREIPLAADSLLENNGLQ
ncbi:RodZ domain-containing protein [Sneathiella sp.]|uniref:helix-turn-helix domain-containing protein n=1 Tax=Sneathiella sp. TaxID=1964365 RepID=UPI0025DC8587|nr:RodZ domain-containing protein [Sneathiella sp.]